MPIRKEWAFLFLVGSGLSAIFSNVAFNLYATFVDEGLAEGIKNI